MKETAEVFNAEGMSIFKDQIHFVAGEAKLKIVDAAPGLYLIKLTDSRANTFTIKFTANL